MKTNIPDRITATEIEQRTRDRKHQWIIDPRQWKLSEPGKFKLIPMPTPDDTLDALPENMWQKYDNE